MATDLLKTLKVMPEDHRKVREIADSERLRDYQAVGAALDAWEMLPNTKKQAIVARRGQRRRAEVTSAA